MLLPILVVEKWLNLSVQMYIACSFHRKSSNQNPFYKSHSFLATFSTSKSFVKKKAALTLLRLFRKHPDVLPVTDWADRIVSLMDDYDLVSRLQDVKDITCINTRN